MASTRHPSSTADPRALGQAPAPSPDEATEAPLEAECVPFLANRVVFLPILAGARLRRMLFLPVPLQMLY